MYIRYVVLVIMLVYLPGCGIIDYFAVPKPEQTAQELYENAKDAMEEKHYAQAAEYYEKLKDNYPLSPYTVEAERALGDALFFDEKYAEAVEAYKEFETLHPRHPDIPYVLYQIGMSNLKTFISIDRPTTSIQEAYEYFQRVKETFPDSPYAEAAVNEMKACRLIMVEHELYIANVFWNMGKYGPAWKRYTFILENFSDVPHVSEYTKERSLAAYFLYRKQESQAEREQIHGSWKKLFNWL